MEIVVWCEDRERKDMSSSDNSIILFKVKLVGIWIKKNKKEMNDAWRIKTEVERTIVQKEEVINIEQMWKWVKQLVVDGL